MFAQALNTAILQKNSRVCVGLDPRLELIPDFLKKKFRSQFGDTFDAAGKVISAFNRQVIEAVAEDVPVVKFQSAFYEQYGLSGIEALLDGIQYAKAHKLLVILDAKRGDIDSTAQAYANAYLGKTKLFEKEEACFDVDCMTVNPFLGEDSLTPFVESAANHGKGIFVLVKTSNSGSGYIQDLEIDNQTISYRIAKSVHAFAQSSIGTDGYSNIGAVVGATYPEEAKLLRSLMPNSVLLVPGIGSQGGNIADLPCFFHKDALGAIINSSRGVVFSYTKENEEKFQQIIKKSAQELNQNINAVLQKK